MKKAIVCAALALCLSVTLEHGTVASLYQQIQEGMAGEQTESAQVNRTYSEQLGSTSVQDTLPVTLYFRFLDTNVLGAECANLDLRREETVASSIVQQLINGPSVSHDRLSGVFAQGTTLISVTGDETTAFVTLNRAFLGKPDGAPADWEDSPTWQAEATCRRYLAFQSIVMALTEAGRYQRVQLYVAENDDAVPERIALAWLDDTVSDSTLMLAACGRDEQMLLTPNRAMRMALDAWQQCDWETLYALLAPTDEEMPTFTVFEARMQTLDVMLLDYTISQGTVSADGQHATLVLDAVLRSAKGGDAQIVRESVPLVRDTDNWAIEETTLHSLMVRD